MAPPRSHELGELQLAVLTVLWSRGAATVHEVLGTLAADRPLAYTTVLTVLRNLERRGLVAHEPVDGARMFRYVPVLAAEDARAGTLADLVERLFAGSPALVLQTLLAVAPPTEEELAEMRARLAETQPQISDGQVV